VAWTVDVFPLRIKAPRFLGGEKRRLAEGAGFEPAIRFPAYTLSRRAP
jgi:hypothetical protein